MYNSEDFGHSQNPVHPYFYPSIFVFTRPNDGWTGLYIKLCLVLCMHPCIHSVIGMFCCRLGVVRIKET